MDRALVLWLWALLCVEYHSHGCLGCLETERISLLELKASINYPNGSYLPTWEDGTDCCSWERIKCNNASGRVSEISLNQTREWELGEWYLNADLLLSFGELQSLDLSWNSLGGWVDHEGFKRWSRLSKLEHLDLSSNSLNESILPYLGALSSLKSLDLSANYFVGRFTSEGFKRLSKLSKLEHLVVSGNSLNESILPYLGALSSLKSLDLSGNNFEGRFTSEELANLTKLKALYLGYNQLNGSLNLKAFCNLENLQELHLQDNELEGSLPPCLSNLSSLQLLDLSGNRLSGKISSSLISNLTMLRVLYLSYNRFEGFLCFHRICPRELANLSKLEVLNLRYNRLNESLNLQALCNLENLQELDLQHNEFEGSLPPCLGNLSSLQLLDLSSNRFSGQISSSLISNLTMLRVLSLSNNRFEGSLSFSSFANLSKLEVLELSVLNDTDDGYEVITYTNQFEVLQDPSVITYPNQLEVETESTPWVPKFQLKALFLSNCNINKLSTGTIPSFLSTQYDLIALDLSHNNMKGMFPSWLFENNERLQMLDLSSNSLVGPLHLPPHHNLDVFSFDVSNNHIYGQLPENMDFFFPNLEYLNMSTNALNGTIPPSIGNMTKLSSLDLSGNNFSGEIPEQLATSCISLGILKLSNNRLQGPVFPIHSNLTQLQFLYLDGNRFTGKISAGIFKSPYLQVLNVRKNKISGCLPKQIGNIYYNLLSLSMSENYLEGPFPVEYCNFSRLSLLDLSQNRIFGPIPSCFDNQSDLRFLHLQGNELTGLMPNALSKISSLVTLDVRHNNISGKIPEWIGTLPSLRVLLLGGNNLQGHIPMHLCQLKNISILDLSNNNLFGPIPRCFGNMTFGRARVIDFSFHISESSVLGMFRSIVLPRNRIDVSLPLIPGYLTQAEDEVVEFITKSRSETYKGDVLYFMSGVDLSWNQLTGEIPLEIGNLVTLHALNLSHNHLTGPIPENFSNLKQIESLDLSHNRLSGPIPPQLVELNFLSKFNVSHNNLSGRIPDMKGQFSTFENTSYEGNPLLCGPPLKNCSPTSSLPPSMPTTSGDEEDGYDIIFYTCFSVSCTTSFLEFMALLYINRYWRDLYFYTVDACIYSCYYFALDNLRKIWMFVVNV